MSRGVHFTDAQRKVLRQLMRDAWSRKRGQSVPQRRMRFNPTDSQQETMILVLSTMPSGVELTVNQVARRTGLSRKEAAIALYSLAVARRIQCTANGYMRS